MDPDEALRQINEICGKVDVDARGSRGMKWLLKAHHAGEGDVDVGIERVLAAALRSVHDGIDAVGNTD